MMIDTENDVSYHGGTFQVGMGAAAIPVESHGEVGYTGVIGFNIFDVALEIINWISPE